MTTPHESALREVGKQRELRLGGITLSGRRRRPSGEKPPLPRELGRAGKIWLVVAIVTGLLWLSIFLFPRTTDWWLARDMTVLNWLVDLRNDALTGVMLALLALGSAWFIRPLRWIAIIVLVAFRKWRILAGAIVAFMIVAIVTSLLADAVGRPRPFVEIIGDWVGYSHPSRPLALLR